MASRRDPQSTRTGNPEPINQQFNRENIGYNSIQNAQVIREERNTERQTERARLRQLANEQNDAEIEYLSREERIAYQTALAIRQQTEKSNGIFSEVEKNVARVRVISVSSTIALWATPIYLTIILPVGLIATLMFGIAGGLYAMFGISSDGVTVDSIWGFVGVGIAGSLAEAFLGLFFLLGLVVLFFNALIIVGASAEYKIAFIKPWFGHATALKIICIILALIGSVLPLTQMAPMALLWVAAVFFYPK
jgi:hypothetical protein